MEAVRLRRLAKRVAGRPLDAARQHVLRPHASKKKPPAEGKKEAGPGLQGASKRSRRADLVEHEGEHSCVLYVEGKIVRQEEVRWPYVFFYLVAFILLFISLAYMVDSCRWSPASSRARQRYLRTGNHAYTPASILV